LSRLRVRIAEDLQGFDEVWIVGAMPSKNLISKSRSSFVAALPRGSLVSRIGNMAINSLRCALTAQIVYHNSRKQLRVKNPCSFAASANGRRQWLEPLEHALD